jgi:hypothetical protein
MRLVSIACQVVVRGASARESVAVRLTPADRSIPRFYFARRVLYLVNIQYGFT